MERDERLLPLPNIGDLQPTIQEQEYPTRYPVSYDDPGEKRSIREYLHVVYKRLPIILAITILATAAAAFYMYRLPSEYASSTSMIIEPKKPIHNIINFNPGTDQRYYNTQLKLLQDPDLMYKVVVKNGLYKDSNLFKNQNKGLVATFQSIFSGKKQNPNEENSLPVVTGDLSSAESEEISITPEEKQRAESYSGILSSRVTVNQEPSTNIVNITVRGYNPKLTAVVANGITNVFIEQDLDRETRKAKDIDKQLGKSIEDLKTSLTQQEQELIATMKRSNIAITGESANEFTATKLGTLSTQWLSAMDDRRKAEANYSAARNSKNLGVLPEEIVGKDMRDAQEKYLEEKSKLEEVLRDYDKQIAEAEVKLKELLVKYTEEYAEVKKARATIGSLKNARTNAERKYGNRINKERQKGQQTAKTQVLSGLNAKLQAARTRESKLLGEYLKEVSAANIKGQAERQLTTLKREIETKRKLLDNYTEKKKEQELAIESTTPDNLKISSKAAQGGLIGPDRNRNILVAFLASLFGGIGLAFLLDYLDDSIRTSDDVSRNLGLPTLALIPHQDAIKKQLESSNGDGNVHSLALIALQDTRSAVAEAYRHLRTSLLFSSAGKPPQTILVTSSQPSEGKTTTAINTAITLAQADAKVVIIDCDLRRPRLHSHFNMHNSHGLTNYLSGEKNTDHLLKPCPEMPNLKIITSGPIPPNPAELLSSNEMKNLLETLKGQYEHIVLDSPPAISFTDSAILSTLVDGVVLVAMAGSSSIHLMKRFKQRLAGLGTRIYGVVINGIKPNSLEYGYYGYNYSYDYYSNSDESTPLLEDERDGLLVEEILEDEEGSEHETKG